MGPIVSKTFWSGKRVFLTGHTGFKGSWLCLWLRSMGAEVCGYALDPPSDPNLYELASIGELILKDVKGDVRDGERLAYELKKSSPQIVIHMAAQPLVRESYNSPVETYSTNVMGTVQLFEAVRQSPTVRAVVNVTTDKCYENFERVEGYTEDEPMGGYDPYSSSKGCAELVTAAYRKSFFNPLTYNNHRVAIATARAGNVIGGGDWANDRLICDCVRALRDQEDIIIRNPCAVRPWQHVLEPLSGYLLLAQNLYKKGPVFGEAWNFGPDDADAKPVEWVVQSLCALWGADATYRVDNRAEQPHEATYLKLDCTKAKMSLGWKPQWKLEQALKSIVDWTKSFEDGTDVRAVCYEQIKEYQGTIGD